MIDILLVKRFILPDLFERRDQGDVAHLKGPSQELQKDMNEMKAPSPGKFLSRLTGMVPEGPTSGSATQNGNCQSARSFPMKQVVLRHLSCV